MKRQIRNTSKSATINLEKGPSSNVAVKVVSAFILMFPLNRPPPVKRETSLQIQIHIQIQIQT